MWGSPKSQVSGVSRRVILLHEEVGVKSHERCPMFMCINTVPPITACTMFDVGGDYLFLTFVRGSPEFGDDGTRSLVDGLRP